LISSSFSITLEFESLTSKQLKIKIKTWKEAMEEKKIEIN